MEEVDLTGMGSFELHAVSGGMIEISVDQGKYLVEVYSHTKDHNFMVLAKEEVESLIELLQELICSEASDNH